MTLPLTVWLGIFTLVSLVLTIIFGFLITLGKRTMSYHKIFSILTLILAFIHAGLVIYRYYF